MTETTKETIKFARSWLENAEKYGDPNAPTTGTMTALVVFDPPHLIRAGHTSWLALKYGVLGNDWREDLRKGFAECFRVLKTDGILVFKWNECQVKLRDVLRLTEEQPLIGDRRGKTHWMIFIKGGAGDEAR